MKKITFLLITLSITFTGFSQALLQGFETPTVPPAVPSNWVTFQSGSGSESWFTDNGIFSSPHNGSNNAVILGEQLPVGSTAKYYIATPMVTIPTNGQLRFWVKTLRAGDQGCAFKVKVASAASAANQTTEAAYTTTLQTYTESQLSTTSPIVYEEQVIDFPAATYPAGTQVYIAFVTEVNQTAPVQQDDFYIDDVLVVSKCLDPTTLAAGTITGSSAVLSWSNLNPTTGAGLNTCNQWEIEIVPALSNPTGVGIIVNSTSYTATALTAAPFTALLPLTEYKYYVRSVCAFTSSNWSLPYSFITAPGPAVCGGNFVDPGGLANYGNSVNSTTTICPTAGSGNVVTVTFTSFWTEATWDVLKVYNGSVSAANLIGTYSGQLTGAALPGPFTSSDSSGCLTFVFTSDTSFNNPGWVANITCAPIPTCTKPNSLTSTNVTASSASIGWIQPLNPGGSRATAWQYIALPCGSPAPTAASTGWLAAPTNPFVVTGLASGTCYDVYVRANCGTETSSWSYLPASFTTSPGCGDSFFDPGGPTANYPDGIIAANGTTTICPPSPTQLVTVTFNSFATENNWDFLKIYDGNSSASTQIANLTGTTGVNLGPYTASSATGCLTFVFTSDSGGNNTGWNASVTCAPRPTCTKPNTLTATSITQSTALLGWTQPANPDGSFASAWQVSAVPCGSPVPAVGAASWVNANSNPFYLTGLNNSTCYEYYVRAVCSPFDSSSIAGPFSFTTSIVNDECTGAITLPVNQNTSCLQTVQGSVALATASPQANSCGGTIDDDDVWFKFTAIATSHYITILGVNYTAAPTNINYVLYTGTCGSLTQFGTCVTANNNTATGLTIGQTYYVRAYSTGTTASTTKFELCIGTNVGTCSTSLPLCAITPIIIPNNVGVPTLPNPISPYSTTSAAVGCLGTAPSPTFYYLQIPTSGNYSFFLEQNTSNAFNGTGIDVDFVAWGPYASRDAACAGISTTNAPGTGNSCSYSAAATETFTVNNAVAGEIYVIMITNFNGRKGFVRITQRTGPIPPQCCPFGNFTYSKNFYCQNEANPSPIFISDAVAGTFSSVPAGLSINPTTGLIDLAGSTPGTYVVHNSIGANGLCPSDDDTWFLTISSPPSSVTVNYSSPTYCKFNTTVQNITQSGTPGGVYTVAPAVGLSLNTTTGAFTPSTSTVGTYVVSYNLPQFGGCPGAISSTTVEIVLPVPTFNQAPPICAGQTSAPLPTTSLNNIRGTWSPAINNLATTTYTFTPSSGECGTTTTMTIQVGTAAPIFTQVSPICTGTPLAALPTTSNNGVVGTWAPPINNTATTTYTFTPNPGFCSSVTTMTITVNPLSFTPAFLPTSPICYGAALTAAALPSPSTNGFTGTWSPALNNLATTTYTFTPDAGQCANTVTKTITVKPEILVTVSSPSVCAGSPAQVIATPNIAGTYTYAWIVPAGVTTNPGNVASFNATVSGAYSVVLTQSGCSSTRVAGNVSITPVVTPTFTAIPTLCQNGTAPVLPTSSIDSPSITGTWNAPISTSNLGPTTYTFTPNASFQCVNSTTMIVTVVASPVATFNYLGTPYCKNGTNPTPTFTGGGTAGTFTSTTGLSLNSSTGAIDLSASTPGNYTITNTLAANTSCPEVTATFTITITVAPIATFNYAGSPYCKNGANPSPTFTGGGIAGTFTSTAGLSINATTGQINLAASTAGTYTVTNTIAPSGGCLAVIETAQVTITAAPVATFSYDSTTYCKSGANPVITITGSTGVFSSTTGLSLNSATGAIDLSTSTPGNYTVTNTIAAAAGCNVVTATFTITITAAPIATFNYSGSPYCKNGANPSPTLGGGIAGTFTSTAGLSINATTGQINLAASTAGTYTVTNTIAPSGGCLAVIETAQVTITAAPVATFSYDSTTYCKSGANPVITITGSTGVFSSTTGLSLNSSTGAIDLSTSTPGNYTVTNTIAAAAGCNVVTATFTITITAAPIATFNYAGSPYCKNGANPSPTFTGGGIAGTFTSTAGLSINATTGQINLAASSAGTYTVTNTIAPSGGCLAVVQTAQVTITALPVATFSYDSTTYCKSGANPVITVSGSAGVFSSTTGLSLNSATGAIDLSTSTPGNYTVTNTIAAAAGCNVVTATFTITITAAPIATFNYSGSPYCKNGANPSPTFTGGGIAGTFTSTAGLSINATTGQINLAASTAGTYTVTNTIAPSGGCLAVVQTAQVTITNLPQATIAYSNTSYCYNNTGPQTVTLTGTTGGSFSASPSGLAISSNSGTFNISPSNSGPYTITYTLAANGGCPAVTATALVTIIPQINVQLSAVCNGSDFTITALPVAGSFNPANASYEWSGPNGYTFGPTSNPSIIISDLGTYTSTVTVNGCRYVNTQQVDGTTCTIQKGISPNGDGDNEAFILSDVKALSIFNRYGTKVYSYGQNYSNQWHGQTDDGSDLPDGTYYYVITRNSGNSITGWIYINR